MTHLRDFAEYAAILTPSTSFYYARYVGGRCVRESKSAPAAITNSRYLLRQVVGSHAAAAADMSLAPLLPWCWLDRFSF